MRTKFPSPALAYQRFKGAAFTGLVPFYATWLLLRLYEAGTPWVAFEAGKVRGRSVDATRIVYHEVTFSTFAETVRLGFDLLIVIVVLLAAVRAVMVLVGARPFDMKAPLICLATMGGGLAVATLCLAFAFLTWAPVVR